MSELTKSEQARVNGQRSRGPVTAEGKARSANNAKKHGRYAISGPEPSHPILLKCESGAAYQDLLHRLVQDLLPTNSIEMGLVREVCAIEWLITRNFSVQTRILDVQVAAECDAIRRSRGSLRGIGPIDGITLATEKLLNTSKLLSHCGRELTRLQRARRDAMNMLFSLRKQQQSLVRSRELPDVEGLDRRTAEGEIQRNEPTDWPLETHEPEPESPQPAPPITEFETEQETQFFESTTTANSAPQPCREQEPPMAETLLSASPALQPCDAAPNLNGAPAKPEGSRPEASKLNGRTQFRQPTALTPSLTLRY